MPNGTSVLSSARVEVLSVNKGLADMAESQEEYVKHLDNRKAETEALLASHDSGQQSLVRTILAELDVARGALKTAWSQNRDGADRAEKIEARLRF